MAFIFGGRTGATPDSIARQREIAQMLAMRATGSAPQNLGEGLSAIGQALAARGMMGRASRAEQTGRAGANDVFNSLFSAPAASSAENARGSFVMPQGPRPDSPAGGARAASDGGVIADDDLDMIVRTVYGEAYNQSPEGQRAVTEVILNRAKAAGMSPRDVVMAKSQFEPWESRRGELEGLDPNSEAYQAVLNNILPALGPEDPTGGADHFYSPKSQTALGRQAPSWDNGTGVDIGGHRFFKLGYRGGGGSSAPAATPAGGQGLDPKLMQALSNPWLSDGQRAVLGAMLEKQLGQLYPDPGDPFTLSEGQTRYGPNGEVIAQGGPKQDTPPNEVREYEFYAQQEAAAGRQPLPFGEWQLRGKKASGGVSEVGTIPQGYELQRDPATGALSMQPIAGGPAAQEAQAAAEKAALAESAQGIKSETIVNAAAGARSLINGYTTGTAGRITSAFTESDAAELRRQVDVMKANATIETLTAMRAASPTGGALGSVTDREGAMLAAASGALDPNAGPEQFARALDNYERTLLRIVHGPAEGDRIFEETRQGPTGAATKSQGAGYPEGTVIENDAGERMILRNGRWEQML